MLFVNLSLHKPERDLALDEVLLDLRENGAVGDVLRVWRPSTLMLVAGLGNRIGLEINPARLPSASVPILRRISGGGSVLMGPGCLNYSLILDQNAHPQLSSVSGANGYILTKIKMALSRATGKRIETKGHTDLAVGDRKCAGHAQKRKRRALLFHGTLLLNFDLSLMDVYLSHPPREPAYRRGRRHAQFVANLEAEEAPILAALRREWSAWEEWTHVPMGEMESLAKTKYCSREWNYRRP